MSNSGAARWPNSRSPFRLGVLDLPNRAVVGAQTRISADADDVPMAQMVAHCGAFARGSVGPIITEGTHPGTLQVQRYCGPSVGRWLTPAGRRGANHRRARRSPAHAFRRASPGELLYQRKYRAICGTAGQCGLAVRWRRNYSRTLLAMKGWVVANCPNFTPAPFSRRGNCFAAGQRSVGVTFVLRRVSKCGAYEQAYSQLRVS